MDWYYKFLKWFKDKYGYDIWDKKFEGEEGKWSIGGILFITIPLVIIYMTFDIKIAVFPAITLPGSKMICVFLSFKNFFTSFAY